MKSLGELLLQKDGFSEILIGNTALVRAMIESGVRVVTSYPGSPTPEIAEAIKAIPSEKRPFYFEFSTNEKVATEVAFGAAVNGHLSTVFFKSVGLNVASDSFVQLGHMEIIGGMVIILGDDPGANSSQNEQDNRHFAEMSYTPVFEPSNAQEAYEMFKEAAKISKEKHMPVILRLTTHVCHDKQKIKAEAYIPEVFDKTPKFDIKNGPYIPITATVFPLKRKALEKLQSFKEYSETSKFNIKINNNSKKGIITMGLPYLSLMDVMEDANYKVDILKIGVVYPMPEKEILKFLSEHDEVKILEELDNVLEKEIKMIAYDNQLKTNIIGKKDIDDWMGEYTPEKVYEILKKTWKDILADKKLRSKSIINMMGRTPQMCPGCGHRSAFHAIKKALSGNEITVGDIGCHTLGYLEPYSIGQVLLCMGHSNGTGAGLSLFNDERKVITFLGDSTFFHAGIPGIINAIFNKHNLLLIVMENGTTAMTGHQDHPAVGKNFNEVTQAIPVKKVLEGLGVTNIREIDTYSQAKLTEMVKEALNEEGFRVIIAKHPCMLKFVKEKRRTGSYKQAAVKVNQEKCNLKYICLKNFACPSYQIDENGRVFVNEDLCIGDGSCLQTCPSSAIEPKR